MLWSIPKLHCMPSTFVGAQLCYGKHQEPIQLCRTRKRVCSQALNHAACPAPAVGADKKLGHPNAHAPSTKVAVTFGSKVASPTRLCNRLCWNTVKSALMPGLHQPCVVVSARGCSLSLAVEASPICKAKPPKKQSQKQCKHGWVCM